MAEEIINDSLPDLKELENKVGRKTPESLLMWMRDAADRGEAWRSDEVDRSERRFTFNDHFSEKINSLKQEMVRIPFHSYEFVCSCMFFCGIIVLSAINLFCAAFHIKPQTCTTCFINHCSVDSCDILYES